MRLLILLPLLLLSAFAGFAQSTPPDYVVTTAGDTLRGNLQLLGKQYTRVRLHRDGMAPTEYGPMEAAAYGSTAGPFAVSKVVGRGGKRQFMFPLVHGPASLYLGTTANQDEGYYLQAPDSSYVVAVKKASNQLTLAQMLPGCTTLEFGSNALQTRYPYSSAGLSGVVMAYNQCRQPQQLSRLVKRDTGMRILFGVKAGLNMSQFNLGLDNSYRDTHHNANGYEVGLTLNLTTHRHWSVQFEALYIAARSTYGPFTLNNYNSGIPVNDLTLHLQYSQMQFPILAKYTAGYGKMRPYLSLGPTFARILNSKVVFTYPSASTSGAIITAENPSIFYGTGIGYVAAGGVAIHLPMLPVLSVEARFSDMFANAVIKHNFFSLDLGVAL